MENKEQKIVEVLGILGAAYPGFELTEFTVHIYVKALSDIPPEELTQAAYYHIMNSKFFPTISELRQAMIEIRKISGGLPAAIEAWGMVLEEIPRVHSYGTPDLPELTMRVVKGLGWKEICNTTDLDLMRAHFLKHYDQLLEREVAKIKTPLNLLQLEAGHDKSKPRLIGEILADLPRSD